MVAMFGDDPPNNYYTAEPAHRPGESRVNRFTVTSKPDLLSLDPAAILEYGKNERWLTVARNALNTRNTSTISCRCRRSSTTTYTQAAATCRPRRNQDQFDNDLAMGDKARSEAGALLLEWIDMDTLTKMDQSRLARIAEDGRGDLIWAFIVDNLDVKLCAPTRRRRASRRSGRRLAARAQRTALCAHTRV